jgi:mono/diheme cytochrome c family protein
MRTSNSRPLLVTLLPLAMSLAGLVGCGGGEVPTVDCATADVKAYSELGDVLAYCTDCHGDRRAEGGIRFDSYDEAVRGADRGAQSIADGSMPPEQNMPEDAQQAFYAWAQCGTPE